MRVAVIGAGASGLTTARWMLEEGLEPLILERSESVGGVWRYQEDDPQGGGIAYRGLRTNTSKEMMAFSDLRFPSQADDFPSRQEVLDYLQAYADRFSLQQHIAFNTTVCRLSPTDDGRWQVAWNADDGAEQVETFERAVVCAGLYHRPIAPALPGQDEFKGRILHSLTYKEPETFRGCRVVVVGAGSSGVDIAAEVSAVAASVELSTPSGVWFLPHRLGDQPYDYQLTALSNLVPYGLRMRVFRWMVEGAYRRSGFSCEGMDSLLRLPPFDLLAARLTPGSHILAPILAGRVRVRPEIAQLDADTVRFGDGAEVPADTIILCTGYDLDLPFLVPGVVALDREGLQLYRQVFAPRASGLAFVGQCIVAGPVFPVAEMQARWVSRVFAGKCHLPPARKMEWAIARHREACRARNIHPLRIQFPRYMEELAGLMGVRPRLLRHARLLRHLLLGPLFAVRYRLDGPGRWEEAEEALLTLNVQRRQETQG